MGVLESIARANLTSEDLAELKTLLNNVLAVETQNDSPIEVTYRVGQTAIVQTQNDLKFWVGERFISFNDFYETVKFWQTIANGGRCDPLMRYIPQSTGGGGSGGGLSTLDVQTLIKTTIGNIAPISFDSNTAVISIRTANANQSGALSAANWSTFNGKCDRTGTTEETFQLAGSTGARIANLTGLVPTIGIRNADNTADAKLKSASYGIGTDIFIQPVVDGQSTIGGYWGLQIGGLRGRDFYDTNWTAVEPAPLNIGTRDSACVIVTPTATQGNGMPSSFTTLQVQQVPWQTGGLFQRWNKSDGSTIASLDLNGRLNIPSIRVNGSARLDQLAALPAQTTPQLLFLLANGDLGYGAPLDASTFQPVNTRLTQLTALTASSGRAIGFDANGALTPLNVLSDASAFQSASTRLTQLTGLTAVAGNAIGFNASGALTSLSFLSDATAFQPASTRLSSLTALTAQTTAQVLFLMPNGSIAYGAPLDPATFQPVNARLTQLTALTAQAGRVIGYNASGALTNIEVLSTTDAQTLARTAIDSGHASLGYSATTGIFTPSTRLQQLHNLTAVTDRAIGFDSSGNLVAISPSGGAIVQRLFVNNVAVSNTGNVNENVIYSFTIPANTLNANSCLDIELILTMPSNANNKIIKIRFGTVNIFNTTFTTNNQTLNIQRTLRNRNAMNSQVTFSTGAVSFGAATTAPILPAIDFTQAQTFQVTGQCAVATDSIQFLGVSIKLY